MNVDSLHEFFVASASVTGALIGLLFVAISVAGDRLRDEGGDQAHRVRALAALTSFTNALSVSLFSLIPGVELSTTALIVGAIGLVSVAAWLLSVLRVRSSQPGALGDTLFLVGLVVILGFQVWFALRLTNHPVDADSRTWLAVLVVVCCLVGIARAWELIGGPSIGLTKEVAAIVRGRGASGAGSPGGTNE